MSKNSTTDPREALRNCETHIRQTNEAIDEAGRQRADAVAAGDLDLVRRVTKRITDLKGDLAALEQGHGLIVAKVAQLDSEARIATCDNAAEELKPSLEQVCAAIERLEEALLASGAAYAAVDKAYADFENARTTRYSAFPRFESWRASFGLDVFRAYLNEALQEQRKVRLRKDRLAHPASA